MRKSEDLFYTYEVNEKGYCVNFKPKTASDVLKAIKEQVPSELMDSLEYFSAEGKLPVLEDLHRVIVYSAKGANEGYYLHVDVLTRDGKFSTLLLAKTLCNAEVIKKLERAVWDIVQEA
jgi:hypothetical protein